METSSKLPIEQLAEEPYASIICYPRPTKAEFNRRLKELRKLGITSLEFLGKKQVLNLNVLGKGCVGIVIAAYRGHERIALKIRRMDADRSRMQHEAEMLEKANSSQVGPKMLGVSKNFLLMQFIDGHLLPAWLENARTNTQVRKALREVLRQCRRLDAVGLDHGELSHAPKHVIVNRNDRPCIVDFETASVNRKPANVTSVCQFLFISGIAEEIAERTGKRDRNAIIDALRSYKKRKDDPSFENLLKVCGL
jgi:putative serine/threonine protein kinase